MSDISEGEFWCELAELLGETTHGKDGIDAPLQISRRRALELVRELVEDLDSTDRYVAHLENQIKQNKASVESMKQLVRGNK